MITTPGRVHRGAVRTAAATALSIALVSGFVAGATPASAEPDAATLRAQASALATQIESLETQTALVAEQYNAVSSRLAGIVTETLTASERLDALTGRSTEVQDQATRRISAIYKSGGGLSLYATVLDGASPGDVVSRLHTVQSLVGNDFDDVSALENAVSDASATKDRLAALAAERTELEKSAQDARNKVESLLASTRKALDSVNATMVRLVAEEQQRRLSAAEAAASAALAGTASLLGDDAPGNPYAAAAIAAAQTKLGLPYLWGGTGPNSFDCSGLLQWAYRQAGLSIMRVASDQFRSGPRVALSAIAPGDFLAWATDPSRNYTIHHIAMYVGNGKMIESPRTGSFVRVVPVRLGPEFVGVVRPGLGTRAASNA